MKTSESLRALLICDEWEELDEKDVGKGIRRVYRTVYQRPEKTPAFIISVDGDLILKVHLPRDVIVPMVPYEGTPEQVEASLNDRILALMQAACLDLPTEPAMLLRDEADLHEVIGFLRTRVKGALKGVVVPPGFEPKGTFNVDGVWQAKTEGMVYGVAEGAGVLVQGLVEQLEGNRIRKAAGICLFMDRVSRVPVKL